jgi:hypothetical protein
MGHINFLSGTKERTNISAEIDRILLKIGSILVTHKIKLLITSHKKHCPFSFETSIVRFAKAFLV